MTLEYGFDGYWSSFGVYPDLSWFDENLGMQVEAAAKELVGEDAVTFSASV